MCSKCIFYVATAFASSGLYLLSGSFLTTTASDPITLNINVALLSDFCFAESRMLLFKALNQTFKYSPPSVRIYISTFFST